MFKIDPKFIIGAVGGLAVILAVLFLLWRNDKLARDLKDSKAEVAAYSRSLATLNETYARSSSAIRSDANASINDERIKSKILLEIERHENDDVSSVDLTLDLLRGADGSPGGHRGQTPGANSGMPTPGNPGGQTVDAETDAGRSQGVGERDLSCVDGPRLWLARLLAKARPC